MKMTPQSRRLLAELGLVYATLVWGSTFYIVKDVVATMHPQLLVGWRFTLSAALLLPVVLWRGWTRRRLSAVAARVDRTTSPSPDHGPTDLPAQTATLQLATPGSQDMAAALTGRAPGIQAILPGLQLGLVLWLLYATQTAGIVYTSASNSGFITGLFIVFVPPLAWLMFRHRPTWVQLLAIGVALAGLALLTGGLSELNRGDALTLVSAILYAWQVLLADRYTGARLDPYLLCFMQFLVTGLLSLGLAALLHVPLALPQGKLLGQLLFLTLLPTFSAFLIQLVAQRVVPPLRVALIFTLEPVFAALFAWTLGGEHVVALRAAGGLLIVGAMLISEVPWPGVKPGTAANIAVG